MKKGIIRIGVISGLLVSLVVSGCSRTATTKEDVPLVRWESVKINSSAQNANYPGEVRGRYETQLAFQVSGKIIKRNVDLGSRVNPGDVLMEIDAKDIAQTVNISSAQVSSAESQLQLAGANLERYRTLFEQGAISRAQLDQYQSTYEVAQAAVRQSSAQYTQGTNQLGYSTLVADSGGIISSINAETGQVVSAGQAVITLVKEGEREIEINVPENRVDEIRNAKQIQVTFWALQNVAAQGQVREISPIADKVSRTYKVRISLLNPPPGINLGMTANVNIAGNGGQQGTYIPLSAVIQTGGTPNVWIITNETVTLRPIKVGVFGDNKVQVLEGLQDGDIIVTAGVQKLHDGQKVRI
ncbi:efflux RND transporter periplasmic adaptor subunit [Pelosinus sp. UFO1]|uniref:efflux RND transporter periplasmic adaptor subunit n=1 Tax=Pelosinus sp. UFO1 TaxID=484770 RepID=UPI0004D0BA42|nr:efflux RND transporter periplasmic adaptor subunit [Pelosinus sp. UFO1]AIF49802.1 efflux transporter, RND family, MFP subunit [Pelosinus sp. UFO1]